MSTLPIHRKDFSSVSHQQQFDAMSYFYLAMEYLSQKLLAVMIGTKAVIKDFGDGGGLGLFSLICVWSAVFFVGATLVVNLIINNLFMASITSFGLLTAGILGLVSWFLIQIYQGNSKVINLFSE